MMDELIDMVDKDDKVIGVVWKSRAHGNPNIIHREIAIVVFNDNKEVLLQQRSLNKVNDPGVWKLTAAGHVGAGEDPKTAAEREIFEELGLKVDPVYFGKVFRKHAGKYEVPESRFFWIYYALIKGNPKLDLDESEVLDAEWVRIDLLEDFAKTHNYNPESLSHQIIMKVANKMKLI